MLSVPDMKIYVRSGAMPLVDARETKEAGMSFRAGFSQSYSSVG